MFNRALSRDQWEGFVLRAVEQLPDKSDVMALARSTGGLVVEDILKTNMFGIQLANRAHVGLFPVVSVRRLRLRGSWLPRANRGCVQRMNHDCDPK
jgi:hypothetical protein